MAYRLNYRALMSILHAPLCTYAAAAAEFHPYGDAAACEACGEPVGAARRLCESCLDRARPFCPDDPYDDLGGEQGAGS